MKVAKGSKITKKTAPYYVELSNSYATLAKFLSDPGPTSVSGEADGSEGLVCRTKHSSTFKANAAARRKSKTAAYIAAMNDAGIIDLHINQAEDEQTAMAKKTGRGKHHSDKKSIKPSVLEKGWGLGMPF